MTTKGALGNLINRYSAVLKKCRIINTFGSLAAAALLLASIAGPAMAVGNLFDDSIPADPDFVVSNGADVGPPKTTHHLTEDQTGISWGVASGADTPAVVYADANNPNAENHGYIWVKSSENGGYAEGMGGKTGTDFTLTNYGSIFVDGTSASATKGMGVNPNGKAFNDGIIAVRKGSAMTDNSGSANKTLVNKNIISVEDSEGIGIFYRKENITSGEVTNDGDIYVHNGGIGVAITSDKNEEAYHNKFFTNTGIIRADEGSTAILVYNTENATINLEGKSRVDGLISLQGKNNNLLIDGVGSYGVENLYVKGSFSGEISNHSNINFTDNSQISLDDSLTIDNTSSVTLVNTSLVRGQNSPESALFLVNDEKTAVNGGMSTRGTASVERMESRDGRVSLKGAVGGDNAFVAQNEGQPVGVVSASLADGRSLDIERSLFSGNSLKASAGVSSLGGAVVSVSGSEKSRVSIAHSDFIGNSVSASEGRGGAIFNNGTALSITDSSFESNHASSQGGAIFNSKGGSLTFNGVNVFSGNTASTAYNDIHNEGSLTVAGGVTKLAGGYTQQGAQSSLRVASGASLIIGMPDAGGVEPASGEALLALGRPLDLGGGSLHVGDSPARSASNVTFGKNSLFVVDGLAAKSGPVLSGSGSIAVDEGSKLYIANARSGESYTVTSGLASDSGDYWKSANLLAGRLIEAEISTDGGVVKVHTQAQDAGRTLPGVIPVNALNAMMNGGLNNTDAESMGIRFLSRAMDNAQFIADDHTATALVNETSRAAVTAGVQNTALRVADAGVDQLAHHLSLSFFGQESNIHKDGVDVWATPMYGNTYTHGMSASGASVRGNYGGLILGADTEVGEILGGKVRAGAAVNGGGGKSQSGGTASSVSNSYNFGGFNLYAGWRLGDFNLISSVGYSIGTHDVSLNMPAAMGMGQAKADVDTTAFVADMRAEYRINTPVADFVPHAGVRYTSLNTDKHELKINGSTLNSVDSDTKNIVQFPVGVTVSKDIDVSGWNIKPLADVSVIPAAGDKKSTTKVSYAGIGALDSVNTRIMDSTSFAGTLGVQAEKGNLALGLNYGVQTSRHETDQNVSLGISWKF